MSQLLQDFIETIRDRRLLKSRQGVLVAVSGGLDSMVLLHAMHHFLKREGWRVTVAHFNHLLRGAGSDADEAFVAETAARLKLPFVSDRGDVRERMRGAGESLEMAARKLRHEFLARTAGSLGVSTIAVAHHADDQVELFFLRLLRGAGGEGLGGMKWQGPSPVDPKIKLIRPLLGMRKTDLELFARLQDIKHREDASNSSVELLRNRVRHELLPILARSFDPSVCTTILRAMEIIGAEAGFAEEVAEQWLGQKKRIEFDRLHPAVQRQCLRLQLIRLGTAPEFGLIEQLRLKTGRAVSVGAGIEICRNANGMIQRRNAVKSFDVETTVIDLSSGHGRAEFGRLEIEWRVEEISGDKRPRARRGVEHADAGKLNGIIVLRHWRTGDRFQPLGMAKKAKLQDIFTNLKIPRDLRRELVVAATEAGEIFWVEGLRLGEGAKLAKSTSSRLEWKWRAKTC